MRPRSLIVKGFSAFRDEQTVDFADLDLFAITGDTGAGKSSILDAITYALFGEIARFHGSRSLLSSAVALGQSRMTVEFDFDIGGERWRVSRSTPLAGGTTIRVERMVDGEFRSAGEGSDKVKPGTQLIVDALGLDFDAFTRSVLLPQGKFQEFLVGDAKERRNILTELLGLELFVRLAERARAVAAHARTQSGAKHELVEREYAGATDTAIAEADAAVADSERLESRLAAVEGALDQIRIQAERDAVRVEELARGASDVSEAARRCEAAATHLEDLASQTQRSDVAIAAAHEAAVKAQAAADASTQALAAAIKTHGDAASLATVAERVAALARERSSLEAQRKDRDAAAAAVPKLRTALAKAEAALSKAVERAVSATAESEAADAAREQARHADMVAAVSSGLKAGDPCPVCGVPLRKAPKKVASGLAKADAVAKKASGIAEQAHGSERDAAKARDAAVAGAELAEARAKELAAALESREEELDLAAASLTAIFGAGDAAIIVKERQDALTTCERASVERDIAARDAQKALASAEREREQRAAQLAKAVGLLEGMDLQGVLARASALAAGAAPLESPKLGAQDAAHLAAGARNAAAMLHRAKAAIDDALKTQSADADALLKRAHGAVGDLVKPAPSVTDLVGAVTAARREAAHRTGVTTTAAEELRRKQVAGAALQAEVADLAARASIFGELAKELRSDKVISFLQHEALVVLSLRASDHLLRLSGGTYRLTFDRERDEFWVIDMANGEEHRPARSLSGGETFLASLALALALSEGVHALALEQRPPLDSLFLDEGFGTLDPEALEIVVGAIEQLGGDGRMVGVITHVRELAERLPARIEVVKGERGSRVQVVAGSIEG